MKRLTALLMLLVMILSGCSGTYSLHDGMYVQKQIEDGQIHVPYILIRDGRFTVVQDIAVSYQPSGEIEQSGNTVTMKTLFAGDEYSWVFELTADDTLKFSAEKSKPKEVGEPIEEGTIFVLSKDH